MKNFFTKNRRLIEIILTLMLVVLAAGYYYLIYIPARENEIIERRFRTLQRIETNMQEKFQGYFKTIRNCVARANDSVSVVDDTFFKRVANAYSKERNKFYITVLDHKNIIKGISGNYDSILSTLVNDSNDTSWVRTSVNGKKITVTYSSFKTYKKNPDTIVYVKVTAVIDYKEFVLPLLRKNVFDHYLVFNVNGDTSNIVYEDFPSGISFNGIDSLFDAKEKVYTSRVVHIETGGEKYLAFLHPCGYTKKNDRIITGLLKESVFSKERQQLPEKMVTTILFIALFTFLLLPVVRLMLMGKKERIRLFDLFAGYLSLLLLVPTVILVFLWNRDYFMQPTTNTYQSKQILASQISKGLIDETKAAYALLDRVDSLHNDTLTTKHFLDTFNIKNLNKGAKVNDLSLNIYKEESSLKYARIVMAVKYLESILLADAKRYKNVQNFFWMDSSGREIANWAFEEDPPRGNYSERAYFKDIQNDNTISLDESINKSYAIEPVVSRTDGNFKVVIVKKSRTNDLIAACASRFSSVMNPILPMGFSFSITDEQGKTIFNSDTTKNLNENMLDEFTDPAAFKAVLNTKTSREFKSGYEDEDYTVLAQPVPNLPYFIVIFENTCFASALNTQCFSFTLMMMFSFFAFLCAELMIVFACFSKNSKLLKNRFDLSWAQPHKTPALSKKYFFLSLFNTSLLLLLVFFCFTGFSSQRITEYIFLFAVAALLSTIAICIDIEGKINKGEGKALIILAVMGIIILSNSFYFDFAVGSRIMGFCFLSGIVFFILKPFASNIDEKQYKLNFRFMVFSKLLLASGLPVIVFFMCIYNFEQRLAERLKLLDYAKKMERLSTNNNVLQKIIDEPQNVDILKAYVDSNWIASVATSVRVSSEEYKPTDSTSIAVLKTSRVRYNNVSDSTDNMEWMHPFGSDRFVFSNIFGDINSLSYAIIKMSQSSPRRTTINLTSSNEKLFKAPDIFEFPGGTIFWILLFGALAFCFQLLKYIMNKIFGNNIPAIEKFRKVHSSFLKDENIPFVFVHGVAGNDTTALIKKLLSADNGYVFYDKTNGDKHNAVVFDLTEIPVPDKVIDSKAPYENQANVFNANLNDHDNNGTITTSPPTVKPKATTWDDKVASLGEDRIECIVLDHFEYNMLSDYANGNKLELIERLVQEGEKRIIISSSIDTNEFINNIMRNDFSSNGNADSKEESKKEPGKKENCRNAACFASVNRWIDLMGNFTNVYVNGNAETVLNKYQKRFETIATDEKSEDNILVFQHLSEQAYKKVWASLTHEEQLMLYDLAEDGLMNTANSNVLTMLMGKGLIKRNNEDLLELVNLSFRNFILTVVHAGEIKSLEKEVSEGQTWNDYKYPVLIVLGALVYFVLSSNPEKFGNVLPLVSGIMAGIPTVVKVLSYLKPANKV